MISSSGWVVSAWITESPVSNRCWVCGKDRTMNSFLKFFWNFLLPELGIQSNPKSNKYHGNLPGSLLGILSLLFDLVPSSAMSPCQKSMGCNRILSKAQNLLVL